jgi:hypothetical protein
MGNLDHLFSMNCNILIFFYLVHARIFRGGGIRPGQLGAPRFSPFSQTKAGLSSHPAIGFG